MAGIETGEVRDVFAEQAETYFEPGFSDANWRVLPSYSTFIRYAVTGNGG